MQELQSELEGVRNRAREFETARNTAEARERESVTAVLGERDEERASARAYAKAQADAERRAHLASQEREDMRAELEAMRQRLRDNESQLSHHVSEIQSYERQRQAAEETITTLQNAVGALC